MIFQGSELIEDGLKIFTDNSFINEIVDDSIGNLFIAIGIFEGASGMLNSDI